MGTVLTESQSTELHKAIIGYLSTINAQKSVTTLRDELGLNEDYTDQTLQQLSKILKKKWTTNTLLQRRIMVLESQVEQLSKELESLPKSQPRSKDPVNWLPVQPTYTLQSHRAAITCVAFHPRFSSLASSSEDCTIKIWDWELGELDKTFKGHTGTITGLDFGGQNDRTILASCSNDLLIKIWDPSNNYANIRTLSGHDHSVSSIRFLQPDQNILVSASRDSSIRLWDVSSGTCVKTISTYCDWIRDVAPSFDGRWLVSGGKDHDATIWDVTTGASQAVLRGHGNYLECCAFAPPASHRYLAALAGLKPDPKVTPSALFVATAGRDMAIKLWHSHGALIKTLVGHDGWVRDLVFHPGGRYLLSVGDDRVLRCWDLAEGARLWKTMENVHGGFVSCIRWVPNAPGDVENPSLSTLCLETKRDPGSESGQSELRCVLATGSADRKVRIFTA
ncbi:nuclear migration protein nudF [Penicillium malachiteum]|uniref:nuclear migration protein nudF n=1 Tax=Penicillium malachiteum TaxID=1324776 RepID=UPI0025489B0F|nr:nuclear migration protein nudF [Penicillium malachiteum]KAJ5714074.1 nuclear migration protein nudF [Penicillium malachiteum]